MTNGSNRFRPLEVEKPLPGEIAEALRRPGGWVYRIAGPFGATDRIPPEAIVGAWKVDGSGNIVGQIVRNKKYDAERWPPPRGDQ